MKDKKMSKNNKKTMKKELVELIIANFYDPQYCTIDLSDLDFGRHTVYLTNMKAERIFNNLQKAEVIENSCQIADSIYNNHQKAFSINNRRQKAITKIENEYQRSTRIYTDQQKQEWLKIPEVCKTLKGIGK